MAGMARRCQRQNIGLAGTWNNGCGGHLTPAPRAPSQPPPWPSIAPPLARHLTPPPGLSRAISPPTPLALHAVAYPPLNAKLWRVPRSNAKPWRLPHLSMPSCAVSRVVRRRGWGGGAGWAEVRVGRRRGWGGGAGGEARVVGRRVWVCGAVAHASLFRAPLSFSPSLFPNAPLSPTRLLTYLMEMRRYGESM